MNRKDFSRIVLFIAIFVLVELSLNALFVKWSRTRLGYKKTRTSFEMVQDQVSIVIIGDSHPEYAVQPYQFENGYNFATAAENYFLQYYKMKHYLDGGEFHPDIVVVPIDPHLFLSSQLDKVGGHDPAFWIEYVDYIDLGHQTGTLQNQLVTILKARFSLAGGLRVLKMVLWQDREREAVPKISGFDPWERDFSSLSEKDQKQESINRATFQFRRHQYLDENAILYFCKLIDLLEEKDSQVVLVWYPTTGTYLESVENYIDVDAHLDHVKALLSDHPSVLLLDYHDLLPDHLEYYADPDHLNGLGSEKFTQILVDDLMDVGLPVFPVDE